MVRDLGGKNDVSKFVTRHTIILDGYDCEVFSFYDHIQDSLYIENHVIVDEIKMIIYKFKSYSSGRFEKKNPGAFNSEVTAILRSVKFDKKKTTKCSRSWNLPYGYSWTWTKDSPQGSGVSRTRMM